MSRTELKTEDRYFGLNSRVWEASLGKMLIALASGRSNLGGLLFYLDQLDFVEGIPELVNSVSSLFTFFDSASRKCSLESLGRPENLREEEIAISLGYECPDCKKKVSSLGHRYQRYCSCEKHTRLSLIYLRVHRELRKLNINPTPEAVLMCVAWDNLAEAYCQAYTALKRVIDVLVEHYGYSCAMDFVRPALKDQLDAIFYYYEPGDVRMAKEERENLMNLVRGVLAEIGVAAMHPVLRSGMNVCKFGYLANKLFCAGADYQYELARVEFSELYNPLNTKIRHALVITRGERDSKFEIDVLQLKNPEYYPAALMPKEAWSTGTLAKQISLIPLGKGDLPIFSDDENVAMNCFVSGSGGGKTTFLGANMDHAINWAGEYVLSILGDEKNGLSLSNMPLFPCEGRTGILLKILESMGVSGQPIPCVNVAYYRNSKDLESNFERQNNMLPPTIFCRKVLIDDPSSFGLEFKTPKRGEIVETKDVIGNRGLLNILEEFALALGYKRVCGLINTLNPLRKESDLGAKSQSKPDILIGIELLYKFLAFRQENKTPSARVYIDELSRFAPTTHAVAGTDTSKAAATFGESIKAMRGMNTSVDCATQKWNEINIEAKSEAFNIFFRNLSKQSDKSHSQRDLVLGSMDLEDEESDKALVNKLASNKKDFPPDAHLWFHYNKLRGRIDIIRPNPPRFMLNQPKKTNLQVYKAYENYLEVLRDSPKIEDRIRFKQLSEANKKLGSEDGIQVLLKSWKDVPTLQYENTEYSADDYNQGAA